MCDGFDFIHQRKCICNCSNGIGRTFIEIAFCRERKRNKYEHQQLSPVHKEIEKALEKWDTSSRQNQEKIRAILRRYAEGEIGLDEAHYELLDNGLIPMPQRCGMSAKIPLTSEDEIRLKERIKSRLSL